MAMTCTRMYLQAPFYSVKSKSTICSCRYTTCMTPMGMTCIRKYLFTLVFAVTFKCTICIRKYLPDDHRIRQITVSVPIIKAANLVTPAPKSALPMNLLNSPDVFGCSGLLDLFSSFSCLSLS